MRRITRCLLWLFVFSLPWGIVSSLPGIGTISRLLGILTLGMGALTAVAGGRIRRPGVIFWFALVFAIASVLSLFWTISYDSTVERAGTYIQFVGLIWVVREFARTREERNSLLFAFCLGALVFAFELLRNFSAGVHYQAGETRYTASGVNPNYVGYTLVLGFPMAWYLFIHHRGTLRVVAALYCLIAPVAVLLTAGRGMFIAGIAALSIVPLTVRRQSLSSLLRVAVVLLVAAVMVGVVVPRRSWDRLLTIRQELETGTMSGRTRIWEVGWNLFQERPYLGAGAGSFPAAIQPVVYRAFGAHNMALALLVEQGVVGLSLFVSLIGACAWTIRGLPSPERRLWAVLMLAWLISGLSGDSHVDKVTWLLFGLLAAQDAAKTARRPVSERTRERVVAGEAVLRPVAAQGVTSVSVSR